MGSSTISFSTRSSPNRSPVVSFALSSADSHPCRVGAAGILIPLRVAFPANSGASTSIRASLIGTQADVRLPGPRWAAQLLLVNRAGSVDHGARDCKEEHTRSKKFVHLSGKDDPEAQKGKQEEMEEPIKAARRFLRQPIIEWMTSTNHRARLIFQKKKNIENNEHKKV